MAFQPKHKTSGSLSNFDSTRNGQDSNKSSSEEQFAALVDQITDAVRERLVTQGVPLPQENDTENNNGNTPAKSILRETSSPEWTRMLSNGAERLGQTGDTPLRSEYVPEDRELAAKIDHTLLKPDATIQEIERVCKEARQYHFATVCVNSSFIGKVAELLKGSDTIPIAVVGFPLGAAATSSKAFEAKESVKAGAREIDMVINIGALKGRDYAFVLEDIRGVVEASKPYPVKVILETSNLTLEEKIIACALAKAASAAFVKTSTGFGSGGATAEDIELMRRVVGPEMGVKASGGIRSYDDAAKMIAAGASRIGASASVSIVKHEAKHETKKDTALPAKKPKNSLY